MIATAALDAASSPVPPTTPWTAAAAGCPKHMAHGPCAGVSVHGGCEVPGFGACSYLGVPIADWPYPGATVPAPATAVTGAGRRFLDTAARRQLVVIDLPAAPLSSAAMLASAAELTGTDALLLGDHCGARLQFPPSYRAKLLADRGHPVWVGVNCRDRNRVAIEAEIAASVDADVVGIHCITGDHTTLGDRFDAQPVFDLDSIDVVRLARQHGALASVAHAPAAPPSQRRAARLFAKADAGADTVFVDHCGGPEAVQTAVRTLRGGGFGGLVLVCVPVVVDVESAAVLESFASGRLPDGYVSDILAAPDPAGAGVVAATALAAQLLALPGVDGVDLSCGGGPGTEFMLARHLGEIARRVLAHVGEQARPRSVPEVHQ